MPANAQPAATTLILNEHVPCIGCTYDLIGIPRSGKCPECGIEVARTLDSQNVSPHVRRARNALEFAALSATVLLVGLAIGLLSLLVGWGFVVPFAFSAAALGALGLTVVEPFGLIAASGHWTKWLGFLPAIFIATVIGGFLPAHREFLLIAVATTAMWGYGIAVQGVATAAANAIDDPSLARSTQRFMWFTRAALFTSAAACWAVYFALEQPWRSSHWGELEVTEPIHRCCIALVAFWLLCACFHWFNVVARLPR